GAPVKLTREPAYFVNPTWSADGERLLVMVGGGGELRDLQPILDQERKLSWMSAAGGELHDITTLEYPKPNRFNHFEDVSGQFNRDASRVWFTSLTIVPGGRGGQPVCQLKSIRTDGLDERLHLTIADTGSHTPCLVSVSP